MTNGKKPNILLIMTDQHRADHTGFGGNGIVQTPNLDSIAASGTVFDKAYVANPICMPNRSSILTGIVPSAHGVRYNGLALDPAFDTFVRTFRDAGYKTALVGKSHLQNIGDSTAVIEQLFAAAPQRDVWRETAESGWDGFEDQVLHRNEVVQVPEDFYGFDDVAFTVNHSDYCSGHYYQWLLERGVDPEIIQGLEAAQTYAGNWQQVWKTSTPEELYPTHYIADQTIARIEQYAACDEPFLIQCSFPDPHHPFTPPGKYFDMYDPASIPLPETFDQDHSNSPLAFQHMIQHRGKQSFRMAPFSPTPDQYRDMAAKEYGMITMIDDAIGRVLGALKKAGVEGNTMIVFTSDHGDVFGDHGLMLKSMMHYDGVVRVPLVFSGPGISASRTSSLVSSLDIGKTLKKMAGLEASFGEQGHDLSNVLIDPECKVRDQILIEEEQMFPDAETGERINMRSVITAQARLTIRHGQPLVGELYDFEHDPLETKNLFGEMSAASLKNNMMENLVSLMIEHSTPTRKPRAMA